MIDLRALKRGTYMVLRTDGTNTVTAGRPNIHDIAKAINAKLLDEVSVGRAVHNDVKMFVNDRGYDAIEIEKSPGHTDLVPIHAKFAVNVEATKLYHAICKPGTTHQIVGDVVLAHDNDFE